MPLLVLWLVSGVVAGIGTGAVLLYARRASVLDHPGPRSLHSQPTPRGGGIAVVATSLAAAAFLWQTGRLPSRLVLAFGAGGGLVALVGWIDDHGHVPATVRAAVHTVSAILMVYLVDPPPILDLGIARIDLGWTALILYPLGVVWLVNLFNFMDGIDGLASTQAFLGFGIGALLLYVSSIPALPSLALAVSGASLGLLLWSWPPARIFMGDVGSGFLGYSVGFFGLAAAHRGGVPLLAWLMPFGAFLFDATVTVLRRMGRGEQWYAPHTSHAYQRLVKRGMSHKRVTAHSIRLTLLLGGLAMGATRWPQLLSALCAAELLVLTGLYRVIERKAPMARKRQGGARSGQTPVE